MGKVYNLWSEDMALEMYYHIVRETNFESFSNYLKEYAPQLYKRRHELWAIENR